MVNFEFVCRSSPNPEGSLCSFKKVTNVMTFAEYCLILTFILEFVFWEMSLILVSNYHV